MTIVYNDGNGMADLGIKTNSSLVITPKKPGQSKVTLHLKYKNKTTKVRFTVFSYYFAKSPIKSIRFNGKNIKNIDYLRCYNTISIGSNKKGSLSVKLRKGKEVLYEIHGTLQ